MFSDCIVVLQRTVFLHGKLSLVEYIKVSPTHCPETQNQQLQSFYKIAIALKFS